MRLRFKIIASATLLVAALLSVRNALFLYQSETAPGVIVREISYGRRNGEQYAEVRFKTKDGQTHKAWFRKGSFPVENELIIRYKVGTEIVVKDDSALNLWSGVFALIITALLTLIIGRFGGKVVFSAPEYDADEMKALIRNKIQWTRETKK